MGPLRQSGLDVRRHGDRRVGRRRGGLGPGRVDPVRPARGLPRPGRPGLGHRGFRPGQLGQADNRGQAVAGLVTGALALVVGLFFAASIGPSSPPTSTTSATSAAAWTAPAATRPARPAPSSSNAIWIGSNWGLLFTLGRAGAADSWTARTTTVTGGQPNPRSAVLSAGSSTRRSSLTTTRSFSSCRAASVACQRGTWSPRTASPRAELGATARLSHRRSRRPPPTQCRGAAASSPP